MKRFFALVLCAAILLSTPIVPLRASAAEEFTEGCYTYTVTNGKATITRCDYPSSDTTIPATLGGYPVTAIGTSVFSCRTDLTSVIIPDSVTSIGASAFYDCSNLTDVTIPNSVTAIGYRAFGWCSSLTDVTIPNSVTTIGDTAFAGCTSLTSITIPDSVTSIGSSVFSDCYSLTSITIPDSVTSIGSGAFDLCHALTDVYYAGSKTQWRAVNIGSGNGGLENAMMHYGKTDPSDYLTYTVTDGKATITGCDKSISGDITIPATLGGYPVAAIGNGAFSGNHNLISVTLPNGIVSIDSCAFEYCVNLVSVSLPDSVVHIGYGAFMDCMSLKSINLPSKLTSIDGRAFSYCYALTSITIPDSVTSIGDMAFFGCALTSITIPDSVTNIGNEAFEECHNLTSITIGNGVTSIGNAAFDVCPALTDVYYAGTRERWEKIAIGGENERLTNATIHYNHVHDYSLFDPVTVQYCDQAGYTEYTCVYGETHRVTLPALGHLQETEGVVTAPTCTEQGYTSFVCSRCSETVKTDMVAALGHDCTVFIETFNPTCEEDGYTNMKCSRCEYIEKTDIVYALGHNMVVLPAVAPTCTETGLTKGTGCSRCGKVGIAQNEVAATGHNIVDGICTNCGVYNLVVKNLPAKLYYIAGEELDMTGLTLTVYCYDGTVKTISEGYTVSGFDSVSTGSKEITVTYEGVSTTFTVIVLSSNAIVIDENGNSYDNMADAITAGSKLTLLADIAEDVIIDKDIVLDLNGHSITGKVTVAEGCTLYGMDSQTDDYTVEDGNGYGKLVNVTGTVVGLPEESEMAKDGYLMITENDGISFHRVNLQISSMSLRASAVGVYFKSDFAADEVVAAQVKTFGVALSIKAMPDAGNLSACQYSTFKNFAAGENKAATSTLLKGIMKEDNAYLINKVNANTAVYGRAYIELADGSYIFGAGVQRSFRQQVEAVDTMWASLSAEQQASVVEMYNTYKSVMKVWEIPNIIAAAQ